MNTEKIYTCLLWFIFIVSAFSFVSALFYTSPYGKFKKASDRFTIKSLPGWLIMEFPCIVVFALTFFLGSNRCSLTPIVFLCIWQCHYLYRSIIFPLRMRDRDKRMPILAVLAGVAFNSINGFLNGYAISNLAPHLLDNGWLTSPAFIIGIILMIIGVSINIHSDSTLRNLRKPGETGYKIPHGGMYRWISAPNYFGEITEWCGFALAAWTPAALSFAVFSFSNLFPRAVSHHRWYLKKFDDYPKNRKAIIPGII
jgi:3-oxo-5-alpha-steroid 4-dehydrogenase 1